MAKRETYETRTEELLAPIVETYGVEIYDVEYVKEGSEWYLRAYIDKPEGVNIIDCENVSRALSDALDKEDFIAEAYILEVSSPGLGRTLKKDKHLEKSIGQEVEIKLYKPIDKCKEYSGILQRFDADSIVILQEDAAAEDKEIMFKRADIALIRLALDF
ncbi:MAG: ribosome maturation factor RimP [Lachnospiraceae bacterium]|nr:ribosome maturation factor RimP [Lachnospiraceae bacterium]